jgi:hypothetical protein
LAVVLLSIVSLGLVMAWLLGPLLFICGAGGGSSPKRVMWMGREEVGSGMVERFHMPTWPY